MFPPADLIPVAIAKELANIERLVEAAIWTPAKIHLRGGAHHEEAARFLTSSVYQGFSEGLFNLESAMRLGLDRNGSGKPKKIHVHMGDRVYPIRYKLRDDHVWVGKDQYVFLKQPNVVMDLVQAVARELQRVLAIAASF